MGLDCGLKFKLTSLCSSLLTITTEDSIDSSKKQVFVRILMKFKTLNKVNVGNGA